MSYFRLSNGEELYYEEMGSGDRTVLMLHGWSANCSVFRRAMPRIAGVARCIVYDQRGHGNSKGANREHVTMDTLTSDLNEIINGLGLKEIILLGWSMGAAVVMNYISTYGCGALRQVVLCDMTPRQMNDSDWKLGLYRGNYTREEMETDEEMDFGDLFMKFSVGVVPKLSKVPQSLLRPPLMKRLALCDEGVLRSLSKSLCEKDWRETVEQITVPVCYFYAVPGSIFSPELVIWYRQHVRTSFRAVAFRKSTHMLISEHSRKFADEVLRVVREG